MGQPDLAAIACPPKSADTRFGGAVRSGSIDNTPISEFSGFGSLLTVGKNSASNSLQPFLQNPDKTN